MIFLIWGLEIAKVNENKKGKPLHFRVLYSCCWSHKSMFSSAVQANRGHNQGYRKSPCQITLVMAQCKRINRMDADIAGSIRTDDDDDIIIAIDSTGIKVTNRGQWMFDKWGVRNKKKEVTSKSTLL